ncbi:MAG: pro-sigmaK processing inhibitor BofA family protein [Ruminococcus sp.]|nr:pro-sigmaK processing inhibitor BofA family protein [Ruminococcus sp.]
MSANLIFWLICAVAVIVMIFYYMNRERRLLSLLFGAFTGFTALILLNKYGTAIGAEIPLNIFNISGSAVLGVPFVAGLVILKYL